MKADRPDPSTAATELRELIREAHGLLRDLRTERRAIQELVDGIPDKVNDRIQEQLKVGLAALGEVTRKAMADSVEKVSREFDRLQGLFLGTAPAARRAGKPSIEEAIVTMKGEPRG